jgi:OOP family OmpA-OmpF porin
LPYDTGVRLGVIAAILGVAVPAAADPDRLEASGFFGGTYFAPDVGLGASRYSEQRPQTSPLFGARLTVIALPSVAGDERRHLELGIEGELTCAAAFTGYTDNSGRDAYFAPVFGWRAELLARLWLGGVQPHLLIGGGGATVVSRSPYMTKETVGELVWGFGATFPRDRHWRLRVDARQGFLPAKAGGMTPTFELTFGLGVSFDTPREHVVIPRYEPPPPRPVPPPDADRDGDGIPDRLDQCPDEPETVNGIDDGDGCPEQDPDGDGIIGVADQCPNEPEDFDHFQDEDGCPDLDNDHDGLPDANDACPNAPETFNGFEDEDGCPDQIPGDIEAAFQAAATVKLDAGKARVSDAAKKSLDRAIATLRAHPTTRVVLTVHPDKSGADKKITDLAMKRADAVKWYMVEQGLAAEQITLAVSPDPVVPKGPTIELALVPAKLPPKQ